jgi:hypothetical protein
VTAVDRVGRLVQAELCLHAAVGVGEEVQRAPIPALNAAATSGGSTLTDSIRP